MAKTKETHWTENYLRKIFPEGKSKGILIVNMKPGLYRPTIKVFAVDDFGDIQDITFVLHMTLGHRYSERTNTLLNTVSDHLPYEIEQFLYGHATNTIRYTRY